MNENILKDERVHKAKNEFWSTAKPEANSQEITPDNLKDMLIKYGKIYIKGIPGIGKSFLARKIAYEICLDKTNRLYDTIWWIDADKTKIRGELTELAKKICGANQIKMWYKDGLKESDIFSYLFRDLKVHSSLLIFDNATLKNKEDLHENPAYQYIRQAQQVKGLCHILLTTQDEDWEGFKKLELVKWTDDAVYKYFINSEIEVDKKKIHIFGGLPLAIIVAKKRIVELNSSFDEYYKNWQEESEKIEEYEYDNDRDFVINQKLFTTIKLSYDALPLNTQNIIDLLSCFAPDELPVINVLDGILDIDTHLEYIGALSLSTYDKLAKPYALYSTHQSIQNCVKKIQSQKLGQGFKKDLAKNYKKAIDSLAECFIKCYDKQEKEIHDFDLLRLLIPHADIIPETAQNSHINWEQDMNADEKNKAADFFIKAGRYHFDTGNNDSAIKQFERGIGIAQDPALIAEAQKRLANVLFLGGRDKFDEAERQIKKATSYFKELNDKSGYIACENDVRGKILQRKCSFGECEEVYINLKNIVNEYIGPKIKDDIHKHSGDVYENIGHIYKYISEKKGITIAERLGSIYHNLGSLYLTWGRPNDYRTACGYFKDAIDFQDQLVKALRAAKLYDLANKKELFLNVSRMLYGVALGLLKKFEDDNEGQWEQHKQAFAYFKHTSEKRRYAYTAYYMLAYSWDRESLAQQLPVDFRHKELEDAIYEHEDTLSGHDEKFDIIKKIVKLRVAVKDRNKQNASDAFDDLKNQLEGMKYPQGDAYRYYDVDTCSVSALLDYALWLYGQQDIEAKAVAHYASMVTTNIEYHRMDQLRSLLAEIK